PTESYTRKIVGSGRCVYDTDHGRFERARRSPRLGERFSDGHVFHGSWAVQGETLYMLLTIDHAASTRPRAG
ncbi:hypothetical protein, partial [Pseudomonas juntendi]|uniref:hypothetical protein n=1 Tax=Pseudomonas juntendi TaxID=2666183 RepID=UPI0018D8F2D2